MKPPLPVQVLGAITNIVLDPLLIFGLLGLPKNRNNRGSDCNRRRVNGRRCCSSKTRFPPSSRKKVQSRTHRENISAGCAEYYHAVRVHILHIRPDYDPYRFFRSGRYCVRSIVNGKHFSSFSLARIVPIISSFSYEASDLEHCNETLSDAFRFDLVLIAVGTLCFVTIPALYSSRTNVLLKSVKLASALSVSVSCRWSQRSSFQSIFKPQGPISRVPCSRSFMRSFYSSRLVTFSHGLD